VLSDMVPVGAVASPLPVLTASCRSFTMAARRACGSPSLR
jgi:hypothetical protein